MTGTEPLQDDPRHEARIGTSCREHAIALAAVDAARHLEAPVVLVITWSGFSACLVSSHRLPAPIFAVTTEPETYRQLAAAWGVRPLLAREREVSYESLGAFGKRAILEARTGREGDSIVLTSGVPVP